MPPFSRPITTSNPAAQRWFNHGLSWCYSFNHPESSSCFDKAIEADEDCAMAWWGRAYSNGPNYNYSWGLFERKDLEETIKRSHFAIIKAQSLSVSHPPVEKAIIAALLYRFPRDNNPDEDFGSWNAGYADAMKKVYDEFGDDLDVACLYADALMNLAPWKQWDVKTGAPNPLARTLESKAVLERALAQEGGFDHIGLLHMYIHHTEMSTRPERALPAANRLRQLAGGAGHLHHMPSHIDVIIGDYNASIAANIAACEANEKLVEYTGRTHDFYIRYRMHDYHSLIYAAMHSGRYLPAIEAVDKMEANLPEDLLRIQSPMMADWVESFLSVRVHVLIRFGRFDDILNLPLPDDQKLYCVKTASLHYAKGVAWAAKGDVTKALVEKEAFLQAKAQVPASRMDFPNRCIDVLEVAEAMLNGEIDYRRQNYDAAFAHLRRSIELDDGLVFSEPWGWMQPARHAYAALSLEQGHIEEAARAYAEDLGFAENIPRGRQHPNNVWALHGYHECLVRLGRTAEARIVQQSLKLALALSDVDVKSSCYCRRTDSEPLGKASCH
ncbi:TPR domain-containing protein [Macroventuria anomochaeta]|uniref:TPR domain-containing protein n=1 Tax=Macroventuria anomochaeta TaxID=301207 RepID=A0ACB6RPM4_9PLEO|nr:TPR domain-containing protein [Macroventuria anomochaeta]KAF2623836.1 TPR domain-containing protein [Macroventuria anomochaeta]